MRVLHPGPCLLTKDCCQCAHLDDRSKALQRRQRPLSHEHHARPGAPQRARACRTLATRPCRVPGRLRPAVATGRAALGSRRGTFRRVGGICDGTRWLRTLLRLPGRGVGQDGARGWVAQAPGAAGGCAARQLRGSLS